jgi:hypothetical protein
VATEGGWSSAGTWRSVERSTGVEDTVEKGGPRVDLFIRGGPRVALPSRTTLGWCRDRVEVRVEVRVGRWRRIAFVGELDGGEHVMATTPYDVLSQDRRRPLGSRQ